MRKIPLFLGGEEIDLPTSYPVLNPATEEVIAYASNAGYKEAMQALDLAQTSFLSWKNLPAIKRADILFTAYYKMKEEYIQLAELITLENGKPLEEAKQEVLFAAEYLRWFAEEARRCFGETIPSSIPGRHFLTTLEPIGVVGAIIPWNFPATMMTRKCAPAIAAGCPVVLKPAPQTPLTAFRIAQILQESGLPRGVLSVLPTNKAAEISAAFFTHSSTRMLSFTGSTAVGKELMAEASRRMIKVSMELGGNAPAIVFADADLELAIEQILALKLLRVGGESCICINRIYIESSIYDIVRNRIWQKMQTFKMGLGIQQGTHLGPVISSTAKQRLEGLIVDAKQQGAIISQVSVTEQKGFFVPMTLIEQISDQARITHEEIFGPLVALYRFSTEEEVLEKANATRYGLAAYFFTRDIGRIYRVGEALEAGFIGVNDCKGYIHEIPMGGYKESGIGKEGGKEGLREYMEIKSWNIRSSS